MTDKGVFHDGYGLCCGFGRVWVDDGQNSNWYEGGSCPRCIEFAAKLRQPIPKVYSTATLERAAQAFLNVRRDWINARAGWPANPEAFPAFRLEAARAFIEALNGD